jgi:hypothetical protein
MPTDCRSPSYGMRRRWPDYKQPRWRKIAGAYASSKTKTDSDIDAKAEQHGAGVLSIFEARDVARSGLDRTARKVGPRAAEIAHKA